MTFPVLMVAPLLLLSAACSDKTPVYPSAQGKAMPYILKEGCTFSIVEEFSRASIASPTVTGAAGASASASVSLGDKSITVTDCAIVANSHRLPIYED